MPTRTPTIRMRSLSATSFAPNSPPSALQSRGSRRRSRHVILPTYGTRPGCIIRMAGAPKSGNGTTRYACNTKQPSQPRKARTGAMLSGWTGWTTTPARSNATIIPGVDDADVGWRVIEYHMAKPHEREIGRGRTPREAIDDAMSQGTGDGKESPTIQPVKDL